METFWASSREEEEKIVERIISDSRYENRAISFRTGINTAQIAAGTLIVSGVGIGLLNEVPSVTISYGQSAESVGFLSQNIVGDIHEIAHLRWKKGISEEEVFTLTSPLDISLAYTTMPYEELLRDYKSVKLENEYFRKELSAINAPQKLQRYSLFYGFLSILSLVFNNFLNVNLIHPILAYFAFCTSAFFYLMGVLMERQETKKCSGKK